jgi:hypothetical protein
MAMLCGGVLKYPLARGFELDADKHRNMSG